MERRSGPSSLHHCIQAYTDEQTSTQTRNLTQTDTQLETHPDTNTQVNIKHRRTRTVIHIQTKYTDRQTNTQIGRQKGQTGMRIGSVMGIDVFATLKVSYTILYRKRQLVKSFGHKTLKRVNCYNQPGLPYFGLTMHL